MEFRGKYAKTSRTRQTLRCTGLRYSANMDAHRRELGEHVRATREAQGIRSQSALADAAGISPRSVAKVELGDPSTGKTVFRALERLFGWPRDSMSDYVVNGGALPVGSPAGEPDGGADDPVPAGRRRIVEMTAEELVARVLELSEAVNAKAAAEFLENAMAIRDEAARQRR